MNTLVQPYVCVLHFDKKIFKRILSFFGCMQHSAAAEGEKKLLKANEARFVALEVTEAYELDKINNGLYK